MPSTVRPVPPDIAAAVAALRAGELVAFPTETVYGLGADARAHAEQSHNGCIHVEEPVEEPADGVEAFGMHFVVQNRTVAHVPVAPTFHRSRHEGQARAERTDRIGQHITRVRTRVNGEPLARGCIGDPIRHGDSGSRDRTTLTCGEEGC